ncbi:MAG: SH3 domain-containing protein [Ruminococcus sp.]|nr:SH3 domain-containing protein [Ruminococcus sp.]
MKKQVISGVLATLMCILPSGMPYAFRNIEASAIVSANDDETLAGYAQRIWELVNEERAKEGLNAVTFNPELNRIANIRASEVMQTSGHTRPDGSSWSTLFSENKISVGTCGENILSMSGMSDIVGTAMSAWMGSQVHRNNIMNEDYNHIGVGIVQDGDNYYLIQIFSIETISWDISGNTFIIGGMGNTPSYDPDNRPWNDGLDNITETVIGNDITEIGRYVFSGMNNLKSATLPESVKKVDFFAFNNCSSLEEVIFMNPECEIEGSSETIPSSAVICGYENSTAQAFAEQYGYNFKVLENIPLTNEITLGDVNFDGKVNAVDASVISMEYALLSTDGISGFTDEQNKAGDANGDGRINAVDASYVLRYYAYLSTGGTETNMKDWLESPDFYEETTEPKPVPADYSLYVNSLNFLSDNNDETTKYCIYDIDNDGTYELITENNSTKHGYSIKNGGIISVDELQVNDFVNNNSPKYYRCDDMSGLNRIMCDEPYTYYDTTDSGEGFIFNKKQSADNGTIHTGNINLNLRAKPTTESDIITTIPDSSEVNIYGHNDDWCYISYENNGKTHYGYASMTYINSESLTTTTTTTMTTTTTTTTTTTAPPVYSYNSHGIVNTNLNLRSAPDLNASIILQMPINSSVTISGYTDEWYEVTYQSGGNTYYGYASRSYITDTANVDWQSAYKKKLESLASEYDFTASDSLSKAMYDLVDINGNGIPELIVSSGEYHAAGCKVYTYVNGGYTATTLSDGGEGFSQYGIMGVDTVNHVARSYYCGMGYEFIDFYRLEGTQFVKIASFSNDEGNNGSDYKYNDISVTKSQYQAYWSQYNYSFDSYGREYTYTSANTPYVTGNVKTYGYTIFDGSQSHLYLSGNYSYVKVYLHYKNTSYDATVYYKGQFSGSDIRISQFNAVGTPSAYLTVTPYSSSGVAGKTITCDIPQTTSGKVEPKGQINTHGGTVAGYTKNYAVNSGTMEKVRTSLGNGWHVTIKQYYYNYNQGVTWYELHDTDDGDYYGWVDGNYIDFYN